MDTNQNVMDKTMERARVENLDHAKGKACSKSDSNTTHIPLTNLTDKLGVRLGNTKDAITNTMNVVEQLEKAKYTLLANVM